MRCPQPGAAQPIIPGYDIVRTLGQGGMGIVYLATHLTLQRSVALKVLKAEVSQDPVFEERFLREARAAAGIQHAHVVTVYDAGRFGEHLYIAFEYVAGGDLGGLIADGQPLAELRALALITACAQGLTAIHRTGIVHRDIKPQNIVLTHDGAPKITDLGLARTLIDEDRITVTGQAMGTPAYMSPEQARGLEDIDARSDIYSLGVTWYVLLTGHRPFRGGTAYETVHQILAEPVPDPRRINPHISPATAALVLRCMAKERQERFSSAAALLAAISAAGCGIAKTRPGNRWKVGVAGAGGALRAAGAAVRQHWRRWPARPRRVALAALAVVLLIALWPGPASHGMAAPAVAQVPALPPIQVSEVKESDNPFKAIRGSIRGTYTVVVNRSVEEMERRSVEMLAQQGLRIREHRHDGLTAVVEAVFADDQKLSLSIRQSGQGDAEVAVQIGAFGDRARAQALIADLVR
jgi:hypothetical protein